MLYRKLVMNAVALLAIFNTTSAQNGVRFITDSSLQAIMKRAKAEHKYVFIDCYTTWCGPCKYMSRQIFPLEVVGNAINDKFLSIQLQMDSTARDEKAAKDHYSDVHEIMSRYNIQLYPTYLFFNSNGELVHRAVGATPDGKGFITYAEDARDPQRQYYGMLSRYRKGSRDTVMLESLANYAAAMQDNSVADSVARELLIRVSNIYSKERLDLLNLVTRYSTDPGFKILLDNADKIDRIEGKKFAEKKVMNIIAQEDKNIQLLGTNDQLTPDWDHIYKTIKDQYGDTYADNIVVRVKMSYYERSKDWKDYTKSLIEFMRKYSTEVEPVMFNDYAWSIFQHSNDSSELSTALAWSATTLSDSTYRYPYMDTYANILYKMGKKDEAIKWEEKSVGLASDRDQKLYGETLQKMKNGEKTWE